MSFSTEIAHNPTAAQLAGPGRRFAGFVLEPILMLITLLVGWIIWYLLAARNGKSPAKDVLGMRVVNSQGRGASLSRMLLRDVVVYAIGFGILFSILDNIPTVGWLVALVANVVAAAWCLWDKNRQCLWDKIVGTRVVLG